MDAVTHIVSALRRLKQKDISLRLAWAILGYREKSCLEKNGKEIGREGKIENRK